MTSLFLGSSAKIVTLGRVIPHLGDDVFSQKFIISSFLITQSF
jgi:hypothetical protein